MSPSERSGETRVALYVREGLPGPARRRAGAVAERLATLSGDGAFDDYEVHEWKKRVPRDGHDEPVSRDLYNRVTRWARERGLRLTPFFGIRECYSAETGERGEWIVFPAMCVLVYEGGELAAVYPHADGDEYRGVDDWLDEMDDGTAGSLPERKPVAGTAD